jgi:hypothetical protein
MGSATSGRSHNPPEIAVYSLKIERDKLDRFEVAAKAEDRTMAQQLRRLIDEFVRDYESNGEAA